MPSFSLGGAERERVAVTVASYERREPAGEYWDDNWVAVEVVVLVGRFRAKYSASFMTAELLAFRDKLRNLYESLSGTVQFTTLEEQLSLALVGDGRGHIEVSGVAIDAPGIGNRLEFKLSLDQSQLASTLKGLDDVVSAFPVRA